MLASLSKGCSSLVPPSTVFPPISPPVIFLFLPPLLLRIGLYLFFDEVHVRRREMYSQTALDRIPIPVGNSRSVSVVTESKLVLNFLHSSVPRAPYNTYLNVLPRPFPLRNFVPFAALPILPAISSGISRLRFRKRLEFPRVSLIFDSRLPFLCDNNLFNYQRS